MGPMYAFNSRMGLFLKWGGEAGSFVYLGQIGLGNVPHVLGNGAAYVR